MMSNWQLRLKNVLWFKIKDFMTFYSMQRKLREGFERQVSVSNLIERCTLQTYTDHILTSKLHSVGFYSNIGLPKQVV